MPPFYTEFADDTEEQLDAPEDAEPAVEDEAEEVTEEDYTSAEELAEILSGYWGASKDPEFLYNTLEGKVEQYFSVMERRGFLQMDRLAYSMYYGLAPGGSNTFETQSIQFEGENGEFVAFQLNEFRSLVDQIINMTVKNRPAFEAQAINTDPVTLGQITASENAVKYYYEQIFGERKEKEVVKCEALYGKGWTYLDWDTDAGTDLEIEEEVMVDMGEFGTQPQKQTKTVKSGAFVIRRLYPWQVASEPCRSEHDGHMWRTVHLRPSKWECIARYPLYAAQIEKQGAKYSAYEDMFPGADPEWMESEDTVNLMVFLHEPCGVLPKGRKVVFVGSVQVEDKELPIESMPLVDLMSCELDGSSFGVSDLWNLIPAEQMKNQLLSDMATNIEAFGRPPIAVVRGSDWDIDSLASGQRVISVNSPDELPTVVQFPQVPPMSIQLVELMRKLGMAVTGLNAISRGEADASVKSGAHAALYHAIAVEAQAPRTASLDLHRERVANIILQFLKKYATHPQLVAIAGEDERANLQLFSKKDVAGVHRVVVKTANPMMRTQAGRLQIAELLRDWPGQPLTDPAQIIELVVSGQLKPLYNGKRTQQQRVRNENAILATGPEVQKIPGPPDPMTGLPTEQSTVPACPVYPTDNAMEHIIGHAEILNSPDTVNNPAKRKAVLAHILEHLSQGRKTDPFLAQLLNLPIPAPLGVPPEEGSASGKGPSDKDMAAAEKTMAPPGAKTSIDETNDKRGPFGNLPKAAQPAGGPVAAA